MYNIPSAPWFSRTKWGFSTVFFTGVKGGVKPDQRGGAKIDHCDGGKG
jgi:hypothetical protein